MGAVGGKLTNDEKQKILKEVTERTWTVQLYEYEYSTRTVLYKVRVQEVPQLARGRRGGLSLTNKPCGCAVLALGEESVGVRRIAVPGRK